MRILSYPPLHLQSDALGPYRAFTRTLVHSMVYASLLIAATACRSGGDDDNGPITCDAGFVAVSGVCLRLCESDFDCNSDQICDPTSSGDSFCVTGRRTDVPRIDGIDGDGTPDTVSGHTPHHLAQTLVITGAYFQGVAVDFSSPSGIVEDILITSRAADRLEVLLPTTMNEEGNYVLQVRGQAGNSTATFNILQGEVGETGFPGAEHITRVVLYGTTNLTDTSSTAILLNNPSNQISDEHTFPSGGAAGVILTAINRLNHRLVVTPAAGSWFTDPAALLTTLNNLTDGAFVVLAARGDVSSWLRSSGAPTALAAALVSFGAPPGIHLLGTVGATATPQAFVFAGRTGLGAGNGVFIASNAEAGTSLTLVDTDIVGANSVNYGVCVKDNANCTIPVANIVGTLAATQLPDGLQNLSITSASSNGAVIITSTSVSTTGQLTTGGDISSSNHNITAGSGTISTTSGTISTTSGNISTATGTLIGAGATINGDLTVSGTVRFTNTAAATCTMDLPASGNQPAWNATTHIWTVTDGANGNNHCYGVFNTPQGATAKNWHEAQLACNSIGAHLVTFAVDQDIDGTDTNENTRADNELVFVRGRLAANTSFWIGLSTYEDAASAGKWVGIERVVASGLSPVTLASGATKCGAITSATSGTVTSQTTLPATSCSDATIAGASATGFVCERRLAPLSQPCASGYWPINGGRICMEATLHPNGHGNESTTTGTTYFKARAVCQRSRDVAGRVCTVNDMAQACASGMNPFSETTTPSGASILAPYSPGGVLIWYGDFVDEAVVLGNHPSHRTCKIDNDIQKYAANNGGILGGFRCCY